MTEATDVTPLLETKENWPQGWRGVFTGSNDEYVTMVVTGPQGDTLAFVRLLKDSKRAELRIGKWGEEGPYVAYDLFDQVVSALRDYYNS